MPRLYNASYTANSSYVSREKASHKRDNPMVGMTVAVAVAIEEAFKA